MDPERKCIIDGKKVEEYYWAGEYPVYVDGRLTEGSYEHVCKRLEAQPSPKPKEWIMTDVKHTAGEWLAVLNETKDAWRKDQALRDAAPTMLEALEQALIHIEVDETTRGRNFAAGNVVRAAIAKATNPTS